MASRPRGSGQGSFFYSLGFLIEEFEDLIAGRSGPVDGEPARRPAGGFEGDAGPPPVDDLFVAVGGAAGSWALARLLRPRSISWGRAVVAGAAATALAQLADALVHRLGAEAASTPVPTPAEVAARYVAGIATAVGYASVLYPRLPGPPLVRGIAFGLLEAGAVERGGAMSLLRQISPRLSFPLETLAAPGATGVGPAAHLAFGLGLGLIYRDGHRSR